MYSYCLFCLQQKTEAIIRRLGDAPGVTVLSPRLVQRRWVQGKAVDEVHPYLPGYLFLYSDSPISSVSALRQQGVTRVLGEREDSFRLCGSDLAFARMLYDCNGLIGSQKVYQIGDRIRLCEGPFSGFAGEITRVDRGHRRMQITFTFDGMERRVWTGYDIVTKPAEDGGPGQPAAVSAEI